MTTTIWLSERLSASAARSTARFIASGNRTVIDVSLRCFIEANVRHSKYASNGGAPARSPSLVGRRGRLHRLPRAGSSIR